MLKSFPLVIAQFLTVATAFSVTAAETPTLQANNASEGSIFSDLTSVEYRRDRKTSRRGSGRREMLGAREEVVQQFN